MISQWKLSEMGGSDFATSLRLTDVGGGHLGAGQVSSSSTKPNERTSEGETDLARLLIFFPTSEAVLDGCEGTPFDVCDESESTP